MSGVSVAGTGVAVGDGGTVVAVGDGGTDVAVDVGVKDVGVKVSAEKVSVGVADADKPVGVGVAAIGVSAGNLQAAAAKRQSIQTAERFRNRFGPVMEGPPGSGSGKKHPRLFRSRIPPIHAGGARAACGVKRH
jgi:hypothetical protein